MDFQSSRKILIYTFPHICMCGMYHVLNYNDTAIGNSGDEHIWATYALDKGSKMSFFEKEQMLIKT